VSDITRPITNLLIANRGEIVRRICQTAQEMGIRTVAVYSDADRDMDYLYAADADVAIGGTTPSESYLVIGKILDAARRSGADAVHPGYGFLAENADFAQAVMDEGLVWVGPPPEAIRAMGLKIQAKETAREVGVPCLTSVTVDGDDPDTWRRQASEVGYPLIIKASAGGGGKGMRLLRDGSALTDEVESARREALSSFGDPTVFMERYLDAPRHVEVQIFADTHGNVVDLFERECSVQRRHQKVIEEAPSPAVTPELRRDMGDAAVALARRIGYVGAGTVEFMLTGGQFYFLEMNTRLQVEHRVTEEICDLDLVRLQLEVAQGLPLPVEDIPDEPEGHAIEVRLYAEDPANGYLPSTGKVQCFFWPDFAELNCDTGIDNANVISPYYDPMIAKVYVSAETRREAALTLANGLSYMMVVGPQTNREMLVASLRHPAFLAGDTTTAFLDDHPELATAGPSSDVVERHAVVAALHAQLRRRRDASTLRFAPSGWRNVPSAPQSVTYHVGPTEVRVDYVVGSETATVEVTVDGVTSEPRTARIVDRGGQYGFMLADLEIDGLRESYRLVREGADADNPGTVHVWSYESQSALVEVPRFRTHDAEAAGGGPTAPLPGTVVAVNVAEGQRVGAGDTLVVVEAMKMEHKIVAPVDATVTALLVGVGDAVQQHQVLVELDEEA